MNKNLKYFLRSSNNSTMNVILKRSEESILLILLVHGFIASLRMTIFRISLIILIFAVPIIFAGCSSGNTVKIAVTKGVGSKNYEMYGIWLKSYDSTLEIINLYGLSYSEALQSLDECDGLVLTGGPDVHPNYFGQPEDSARCSIDGYRDTMEFDIISHAEKMKIPILAVCRGEQIINVAHGGSLIVDIPADYKSDVQHQISGGDSFHDIIISENSLLYNLTGTVNGTVNSNHHQAVKELADIYVSTATGPDGIIEAFEYKDKSKPFFMAVQWHPERLEQGSKFAEPIGAAFINEVKLNKQKLSAKK